MTRRSGSMGSAPHRIPLSGAPEHVPGYRDLEQIGHGGFSVVYRAVQESFERSVAVKVLTVVGPGEDARRAFEREMRLTGRLSGHPHVVTVLDTGTTVSGRPFLAMELYEGGSMKERIARGGPLDPIAAATVGAKIADALTAVHALGVLHRDVKPNNILLSRYGEPALADFGVSCLLDPSSSGSVLDVFSPQHAAPELMTAGVPSVSSDVYGLGSTLYELLTGRPPFGGPGQDVRATMFRAVSEPPPRPACPGLPGLADAVQRAMAKDPAERFPDAAAFAQALWALIPDRLVAGPVGSDLLTLPGKRSPDATDGRHVSTPSETITSRADDTMLRPDRAVPRRMRATGAADVRRAADGGSGRRGQRAGSGERGTGGVGRRSGKPLILVAVVGLLAAAAWAGVTSQGSGAPRDHAAKDPAPVTPSQGRAETSTSRGTPPPSPTRPSPSPSTSATPKRTASPSPSSAGVAVPPATSSAGPLLPGTFHRLQNAQSGDCLAQPAGSGAAEHQGCTASRSEGWKYSIPLTGILGAVGGQSELVNGLSGDCLTAGPGGQVSVAACTGLPEQLWSRAGAAGAEFQNAADGQCLKSTQGAVAEGPCTVSDQAYVWAEDGTV